MYKKTNTIKPCPRGGHSCVQLFFCWRDLDINPMILKLEGDLDIPKMYLHTENAYNTGWDMYGYYK